MTPTVRPTIGFVASNVHVGAARALWRGILDAAEAGNANLICYPGGRFHASDELEAQRNVLYDLIHQEGLDGLISWTSTLAGPRTSAEVAEFHERFHSLPIVALSAPVGRGSTVSIDGDQGMRHLIDHLVDEHHYRKLALISGPEAHPYALDRHRVFLATLQARGIIPDASLITPHLGWERGAEAMQILLDQRGLKPGVDFQAVVATSDLQAIGALYLLAERGIQVPADVAVVGFNDSEEGRLVRPPLTSVSLPFYEQGRRSVEILLGRLEGQEFPDQVTLESRLLVRQSCGCPSRSVDLAAAESVVAIPHTLPSATDRARARLTAELLPTTGDALSASSRADQLIASLLDDLASSTGSRFLAALDSMLQQAVLDGDETAAWQAAVSVLRSELLPALDGQATLCAEDLFGQGRVVIGEAVQRAQIARQLEAERQSRVLRFIGQALITTFDVDRLSDVLAERLPELGIESCYLGLYEDPSDPTREARLVFADCGGIRADLSPSGRILSPRWIVPPDLLPSRRHSLLVEPLFFRTEPIGFAVFEVGPQDGATYEVLRGHISSALKGALLLREAREARRVAESADQIKTRLLTNVSHELRTPLNIILGHTQRLLREPSGEMAKDLQHIQHSAEHQLRIINDLLDLSRAEINALDLYPVILDPRPLIEDAFAALAENAETSGDVVWRLEVPDRLPEIEVDPVRLRQILLNLLSNASRFTERGQITLGAEPAPPHLHIWVRDTGVGLPADLHERIYEPFFTAEPTGQKPGGIGLGLSITRHLVALHKGILELESEPGKGSTFHVYLPLPIPARSAVRAAEASGPTLWLISEAETPTPEVLRFCRNRGLTIQRIAPQVDLTELLSQHVPEAVAVDLAGPGGSEWPVIRRLQNHPQLSETPFLLFGRDTVAEPAAGLTALIMKQPDSQALLHAIGPELAQERGGSVLIIDDDEASRRSGSAAVAKGLPGFAIRTCDGGAAGLEAMTSDPPSLVILDLMMPELDGFDVLDRMREDERTRRIPVVILSGRQLTLEDVQRLERHPSVLLRSKGVQSEEEVIAALHRSLFGTESVPPQTSALAKRAVAYLHQHYALPLKRWEIAEGVGVSEDYLSRVFGRELGISPWEYLNRYRTEKAKELLRSTYESVALIGSKVGFPDPAYFSRVFHRIAGMAPTAYRDHPDP